MNPLNLMKTNTTKFMLAMIFNDDVTYNDILKDHFIDSYMSDFNRPENDGYLLIAKSINEEPRGTINPPIRSYKNDTDYIFVYEIPKKYEDDFANLICNDFDSMSDDYKLKLLKFWEQDDNTYLDDKFSMGFLLYVPDHKLRKTFKINLIKELYRITEQ